MKKILVVASFLCLVFGGILSGGFFSDFGSSACLPSSASHSLDCSGGKISVAIVGLDSVTVSFLVAPILFFLGFFVRRAITRPLSLRETGPPVFV